MVFSPYCCFCIKNVGRDLILSIKNWLDGSYWWISCEWQVVPLWQFPLWGDNKAFNLVRVRVRVWLVLQVPPITPREEEPDIKLHPLALLWAASPSLLYVPWSNYWLFQKNLATFWLKWMNGFRKPAITAKPPHCTVHHHLHCMNSTAC